MPKQIMSISIFEFMMLSKGYQKREELKWLHTREIMTIINNTSQGCKQISSSKLVPLSLDKPNTLNEEASINLFTKFVKQ